MIMIRSQKATDSQGGTMRPFSFEEYARCWRDNPKQMEKYTLTLQDFAENAIRETADRLHQEGRRATARQLMQYGEKLKFVSRHPSEFQSEEAKKQWASDIGALEGFGSFVRRNNLRIQMPSVEDDAEKEQQKINRFAQQQQQNQNKEYRGMVDLVEMLFDAMEKAFSIDRRRTLGTDLKEEGTLY